MFSSDLAKNTKKMMLCQVHFHPTIRYWESTMAVEIRPDPGESEQLHLVPYAVVNERSLESNRNGMKPNLPNIILDVIYRYVSNIISEENIDSTTPNHQLRTNNQDSDCNRI